MKYKAWLCVAVVIAIAFIGCFVGLRWASRQAPDFYVEALKEEQSPKERQQAAQQFAEQTANLVHEIQYSTKWEHEFSQSRVNAWLSEELPEQYAKKIPKGVHDPRVQFQDGRIRFGFRLTSSRFDGIVVLEARPTVPDPNKVSIVVESLSAGILPLVAASFTDEVSRELNRYHVEHEWTFVDNKPILNITIPSIEGSKPVLEELRIDDEKLVIAGTQEGPAD